MDRPCIRTIVLPHIVCFRRRSVQVTLRIRYYRDECGTAQIVLVDPLDTSDLGYDPDSFTLREWAGKLMDRIENLP